MAIDRLSNLPQGIILFILSRLEIHDAVRTCILSKRWSRLWTRIPCLNINSQAFEHWDTFQFFLLRFIIRYNPCNLYTCNFVSHDDDLDYRLVRSVIDYAIKNQVAHLLVDCPNLNNFQIPPQLSTVGCRSLEGLTLRGLSFQLPEPFYLISLVTINLDGVTIGKDIMLGCINLESFMMKNCKIRDMDQIAIIAHKLVMLDIQYKRLDDSPKEMRVIINAPKLESLSFSFDCDSCHSVTVKGRPALESASIDFYQNLTFENTEDVTERSKYVVFLVGFLKDVSNAKSLTLSAGIIKLLSTMPEKVKMLPSPFHNLKYLKVLKDSGNQSIIIPPEVETFLVGGSPNGPELLKATMLFFVELKQPSESEN
ncbi:hypothetical protein ACFE04_011606 [Oxalis oulophora]